MIDNVRIFGSESSDIDCTLFLRCDWPSNGFDKGNALITAFKNRNANQRRAKSCHLD